jgi:hypothetical protein
MSKTKVIFKSCGKCHLCGKEHMSNEGGWIINAEKLNFCYAKEDDCYDQYLAQVHAAEKQPLKTPINNDDRMNMYIEYLKKQKCKHKYQTEE